MKIQKEDKQVIIIATAMVVLLVTLSNISFGQEIGDSLDEDQAVICIKDIWTEDFTAQGNEKVACMIIDDLDILTEDQTEYIYSKFRMELDTFNLSDISGMID